MICITDIPRFRILEQESLNCSMILLKRIYPTDITILKDIQFFFSLLLNNIMLLVLMIYRYLTETKTKSQSR